LVGLAYYEGRGNLRKDETQARAWLEKSARQGDDIAKEALARNLR
jgi:TPR repeat protein